MTDTPPLDSKEKRKEHLQFLISAFVSIPEITDTLSFCCYMPYLERIMAFKEDCEKKIEQDIPIYKTEMEEFKLEISNIWESCMLNLRDKLNDLRYKDYLDSGHWQLLSYEHKEAAEWKCQLCNSTKPPLHTHHRSYERKGTPAERKDLIVLCARCHAKFHNILPKKEGEQ